MRTIIEKKSISATGKVPAGTLMLNTAREKRIWSFALLLFAVVVILRNAWITEDAYIMFRTIDNFINGHGLTWNIGERVQTFTNPLWTLLLSGITLITGELYYTSIFMGAACTLLALWLLARRIAGTSEALVLAFIPLIFSKAFIDYSTSGLENPFTFLALALFFSIYLVPVSPYPGKRLFLLSLVMGMALLNRMDTLLLFAPAFGVEFFRLKGWLHPGKIFLGLLPFVIWEIFSLLYYGTLFPNTAYAKLNTGVPVVDRIEQGMHYMLNSLAWDPITLLGISAGVGVLIAKGWWRGIPLGVGVVLYMLYTVRVGGDFMSGRFLAAPLFVAAIGLAAYVPRDLPRIPALAIAALVALFGISNDRSPVTSNEKYHMEYETAVDQNGIADERGYYFHAFGLLNSSADRFPDYFWRDWGEGARANAENEPVIVFGNIGVFGYYAGPEVHIVDHYALADPLMARLPAQPNSRIGHFTREVPPGYVATLREQENLILHPDLAAYYDALSVVVKDPIFTWSRFRKIFELNTGHYEHLLDSYKRTRHLVVQPMDDLLQPDLFQHHAVGWWGELENGRVWGIGHENHLVIRTDEAISGILKATVTSPVDDQQVQMFSNGELLQVVELSANDPATVEIAVDLPAQRENWITFRYARWNTEADPIVPEQEFPVSVEFQQLGLVQSP